MNIIEPSFEILNPLDLSQGIAMLQHIEAMARISHNSEQLQNAYSWQKFIHFVVMTKGDWSVVEHAFSTVLITTDRGISHEIVRHRLASFTQSSTRFINYSKKEVSFIRPVGLSQEGIYKWEESISRSFEDYKFLLSSGARPQEARSVLPNSLVTTLAMSCNLRNWRHFLIMRTTQETHPAMKEITIPLLAEFQKRIPLLFDDIVPNLKQSEALSKPR